MFWRVLSEGLLGVRELR